MDPSSEVTLLLSGGRTIPLTRGERLEDSCWLRRATYPVKAGDRGWVWRPERASSLQPCQVQGSKRRGFHRLQVLAPKRVPTLARPPFIFHMARTQLSWRDLQLQVVDCSLWHLRFMIPASLPLSWLPGTALSLRGQPEGLLPCRLEARVAWRKQTSQASLYQLTWQRRGGLVDHLQSWETFQAWWRRSEAESLDEQRASGASCSDTHPRSTAQEVVEAVTVKVSESL